MVYTPPSVRVTSIANNRIINIDEDARIPCIVGEGPTTRTVTDTAIVRGSGGFDVLPNSGSAVGYITLSSVSPYPGAAANYSNWVGYFSTSGSSSVYWDGTAGSTAPREGEVYYVSYTYPVPSDQFDPQLFVDSNDVKSFYGVESTSTGKLTVAANMALENGAPAIMCVQVQGNPAVSANWSTALDKLKKKSSIAYIVPVASGSAIQNLVIAHVAIESNPDIGHERECIIGADTTVTDVSGFVTKANALDNKQVILVAPDANVTRTASAGTALTLGGEYIAAALSGLITSQDKVITPVTGKQIVGFTIPNDQYEPYDMNRMANAGVCIIYAKSGVVKVRHAITTDTSNADNREISVVAADDLVRRITRTSLADSYIGKGIVISESTPAAVAATVKAIWNSMVRDGLIASYGTKNDPTTGEVAITASQDPNEPTRINVTGSVKFLYPLNYISVEFYIYV